MYFTASDSGDEVFLRMLQSHCPARQRLELRAGAQVILVKTTAATEGLVNGARGIITGFAK
jgi:ATP-dependent DNA helicase PIF1